MRFAKVGHHAGHLLPHSSAAGEETQQPGVWSSSSETQSISVASKPSSDSRSTAHDSSDLADMLLSDAPSTRERLSASASAELSEESRAASLQSDPLTIPDTSAVSSPAMLRKPERKSLHPDQSLPEVPSAPGGGRGAHHGAVDRPCSPKMWNITAASQTPYGPPAAPANPSRLAGIQKRQPAVIPHVAALGALVGALARASELDQALQLYKQVSPSISYAQIL